jgi:hypothetical protein
MGNLSLGMGGATGTQTVRVPSEASLFIAI